MGAHTDHTLLPATRLQQCVCNVSAEGNPVMTQYLKIIYRAGHTDNLCPVVLKFQTPRRKQVFSVSILFAQPEAY